MNKVYDFLKSAEKQILENPKVKLSAMNGDEWIRFMCEEDLAK